jgi:hypothetical protein
VNVSRYPAVVTRRIVIVTCAALFLVGFALYAPSFRYGFVEYDDVRILLDHPHLYDERSFLASLREIFVAYFPREEPLLLRDLSWALDSRLFGFKNPFGYHLGNVLLNAINAPLLLLFLLRATGRFYFAALVAAAFTLLPVHVEPVCWVMGRKDVLSACFSLLTLLCEAEAFRAEDVKRRRRLRAVGFVGCALAMLSKTSAVTLVLVIAAYRLLAGDLAGVRERPVGSIRDRARELVGLWPHVLVSVAVYLWYSHVLHQFGVLADTGSPPLYARLAELARLVPLTLGLYVASIFTFSDYSIIYQWPDSAIPLTATELVASAACALALIAFFVFSARRRRDLLFYGIAFVALLLPYLHIVSVIRWRADRYLYLAAFCVLAVVLQLATELLHYASPVLRRVTTGAALAWALSAAFVTLTNAPRFRDDHALWSYEVGLRHPSVTAYVSLAASFAAHAHDEKDPTERLRLLDEAERVGEAGRVYYESIPWRAAGAPKRDYADLYAQLGQVATLRGEPLPKQLALYQQSYRIFPTETNILFLAQTLFRAAGARGDIELARKSLRLYTELVAWRAADGPRRALARRVLDAYRAAFPSLAPDVDAVERTYLH